MEIKPIQAIHTFETNGKFYALISVYKARKTTFDYVLAEQIIYLNLQFIAAK